MIITLKGADFSQNNIGRIIDYSAAKEFLTAHYPNHADNTSAEALQVFWNTLGKGTTNSIYDRLRWLLLPIFGSSVTEDLYDAKNEAQRTSEYSSSLAHLRRGVVFAEAKAHVCPVSGLPDSDADNGGIFYVGESNETSFMGNGGVGGYLKVKGATNVTTDSVSETQGGTAIGNVLTSGNIIMAYESGYAINDVVTFKTNEETKKYYRLTAITGSDVKYNKRITALCSHASTSTAANCNTSNPVMMVGSIKNMTDADATTLISAIQTLRTALNV